MTLECERTSCSLHSVMRVNVVFDEDRNTMEWSARFAAASLIVEG